MTTRPFLLLVLHILKKMPYYLSSKLQGQIVYVIGDLFLSTDNATCDSAQSHRVKHGKFFVIKFLELFFGNFQQGVVDDGLRQGGTVNETVRAGVVPSLGVGGTLEGGLLQNFDGLFVNFVVN